MYFATFSSRLSHRIWYVRKSTCTSVKVFMIIKYITIQNIMLRTTSTGTALPSYSADASYIYTLVSLRREHFWKALLVQVSHSWSGLYLLLVWALSDKQKVSARSRQANLSTGDSTLWQFPKYHSHCSRPCTHIRQKVKHGNVVANHHLLELLMCKPQRVLTSWLMQSIDAK